MNFNFFKIFALIFSLFMISLHSNAYAIGDKYPRDANKDQQYVKSYIEYGNKNAPVEIRELYSLTCHFCAEFEQNVMSNLYASNLFKQGLVKVILDPFPLGALASIEQQLASCIYAIKGPSMTKNFINAIYKSQHDFQSLTDAQSIFDKLRQVATSWGINKDLYDACVTGEVAGGGFFIVGTKNCEDSKGLAYDECIMQGYKNTYNFWTTRNKRTGSMLANSALPAATPTIFINGVLYEGKRDWESFSKALEAALNKSTH